MLKSFDVVVCVYFLFVALTWFSVQFLVVQFAQSCLTLCDPMDPMGPSGPPGSSVHEILQARILEWVAISFSRASSQVKDGTWVSCIAGRFFTI